MSLGPVHPRVCGELGVAAADAPRALGSSPRLRGTRSGLRAPLSPERFIPASAGNSRTPRRRSAGSPVHPRVCGELDSGVLGVARRNGSSPRLRGTHVLVVELPPDRRFIPASAGNSSKAIGLMSLGPVHPRVCGELGVAAADAPRALGSSPRLRGTRSGLRAPLSPERFIPASAGNSRTTRFRQPGWTVHPRVCGELTMTPHAAGVVHGSSPRLRGTRLGRGPFVLFRRFIPASAGNSAAGVSRPPPGPVHPRVCGELALRRPHRPAAHGSSPRLRGTRLPPPPRSSGSRFIPASAGNSHPLPRNPALRSVHPRVCGELLPGVRYPTVPTGSSPRLRGTRGNRNPELPSDRFIPASAGNSPSDSGGIAKKSVHPRVCGELAESELADRPRNGSSPRLRGTPCQLPSLVDCNRFIPASAGNSAVRPTERLHITVHPRVCGELTLNGLRGKRNCGSSPRLRGTRKFEPAHRSFLRFIPASAGNSLP